MSVKMNVESYRPSLQRSPTVERDGTVKGPIETYRGMVEYFSFPGDGRHRAFTSMQIVFGWMTWSATIPKYYKPRWAGRLCSDFAEQCWNKHECGDF